MSYQVIARKYRPQRFADVVGQEHVTQTLANAIAQNRIAHAYLFCGPRGTGKTTIARIFAKCLNCTGGPKVDFAEDDPRCREIAEGRSIDVLEIDGASNNGVEQVRELRETVKYAPASSKFKIYIIDEVHMLTTAAFNALLKTLEEPPEHVKFFFATTDPEKVLPTILSRCQRFDLRRIPLSLITRHLSEIARKEKVDIDAEALHAVARGADGGMRDAESALDQLISFCGTHIVESDVLSMFGLTARSQVVALAQAILQGDAAPALQELDQLARHGKDLGRLLSDLLNHFRNLLILQVSKGDLKLLEVSEVESASLKSQAGQVGTDALTRVMEVFTEAEGRLRDATSKKIFIEVALLKAIQAIHAVSLDEVLKQLNRLRGEQTGGTPSGPLPSASSSPQRAARSTETPKPSLRSALAAAIEDPAPAPLAGAGAAAAAPAPAPAPAPTVLLSSAPAPSAPAPAPAPAPKPPQAHAESPTPASASAVATLEPAALPGAILTEDDLVALWREVLEGVGRASPFTRNYLIEAHPVSFARNVLTIGFDPQFSEHIDLVNNQKTHALLQTKLSEAGRPQAQIRFVRSERPSDWAPPATPPSAQQPPRPNPATSNPPPPSGPAPAALGQKREKVAPTLLSAEEFKNDPLIQKALEIFKARIVEVRA